MRLDEEPERVYTRNAESHASAIELMWPNAFNFSVAVCHVHGKLVLFGP